MLLPQTALVPLCPTCTVFSLSAYCTAPSPFSLAPCPSGTGFTAAASPPLLLCRTAALPSSLSLSCPCTFADAVGFYTGLRLEVMLGSGRVAGSLL